MSWFHPGVSWPRIGPDAGSDPEGYIHYGTPYGLDREGTGLRVKTGLDRPGGGPDLLATTIKSVQNIAHTDPTGFILLALAPSS